MYNFYVLFYSPNLEVKIKRIKNNTDSKEWLISHVYVKQHSLVAMIMLNLS